MVSAHSVTVRGFEPEDEPRVLALLGDTFGRWPTQIESITPAAFFRWKHLSSPFGSSVMYVGELDGALAGFTAYMPWLFTDGRRRVRALRGVDFAVAPPFRRHGVSHAMRTAANSLTGAAFIWANPNAPAFRGGVKAGRSTSGRVPHFARLCGRPLQTARRVVGRGRAGLPHVDAQSADAVLTDEDYVSFLLGHMTHAPGSLATARDLRYLRWRYGRLDEYRAVRASRADGQGGIAIFRVRPYRKVWIADICELLLEPTKRAAARRLLREVRDTAATDLITCSFQSRREATALGFVQASRGAPLITYPLQQSMMLDFTSGAGWALSRGDLELL